MDDLKENRNIVRFLIWTIILIFLLILLAEIISKPSGIVEDDLQYLEIELTKRQIIF